MIAKTGTAEYADGDTVRTHAWMIAAQGDPAVAVFVQTGKSGSQTAGPLLEGVPPRPADRDLDPRYDNGRVNLGRLA